MSIPSTHRVALFRLRTRYGWPETAAVKFAWEAILGGLPVITYAIANPDQAEGADRYQLVCAEHGATTTARTRRDAETVARVPDTWCAPCSRWEADPRTTAGRPLGALVRAQAPRACPTCGAA